MENNYDRKRREILRAAASVFWERGYSSGTTKEVAERVGLSQPAIYHYVGSKSTLLRHIVTDVYSAILRSLEDARTQQGDPEAQLTAIVHSLTYALTENSEMFGVFWQEFHRLPADLRAMMRNDEREFVREVQGIVAELRNVGRLPKDRSPAIMASAILGMVSWTYQWYRSGRSMDADTVAATFLDLIGIGPAVTARTTSSPPHPSDVTA